MNWLYLSWFNICVSLSSHEFQVLSRIGLDCPDLETLCIKDQALSGESQSKFINLKSLNKVSCNSIGHSLTLVLMVIGAEKIMGWALSHHFMHCSEASLKESKFVISSER